MTLARMDGRLTVALLLAAAAGAAIALVDSSPTRDDTGLTVMALLVAAGVTAAIAGRRPWLVALLVGGFVPLLEIPRGGGGASLFSLVFAGVGSGVGYMLGQVLEQNS